MRTHPNPDKIDMVMNRLEEMIAGRIGSEIDFTEIFIKESHLTASEHAMKYTCKTVACHAGWLGYACLPPDDLEWEVHSRHLSPVDVTISHLTNFGYSQAAKRFTFVVFETVSEFFVDPGMVPRWADENPDLWGNPCGRDMFDGCGYMAFISTAGLEQATDYYSKNHPVDLPHIITHWRGVATRIREWEQAQLAVT